MRIRPLALIVLAAPSLAAQTVDTTRFRGAHAYLTAEVDSGAFPGAVLAVGLHGRVVYQAAVGHYGVHDPRPVTDSTVYDWIQKGWLEADKVYGEGSKVGRYHISPLVLEEMDKQRDRIVEESKRYWMRLYVKFGMKKKKTS